MAQLGTVLSDFPEEVVVYVTSPKTGLQRRSKWPPTLSEVLEACEQHQDYLRKMRESRSALPFEKPYEKPSDNRGSVFVATTHPGYAKLTESWKLKPYTAPDGRPGVLAPAELLVDMGLMKKGAAH